MRFVGGSWTAMACRQADFRKIPSFAPILVSWEVHQEQFLRRKRDTFSTQSFLIHRRKSSWKSHGKNSPFYPLTGLHVRFLEKRWIDVDIKIYHYSSTLIPRGIFSSAYFQIKACTPAIPNSTPSQF